VLLTFSECIYNVCDVQFSQPDLPGYVGFANLPNQVHRKSVKKGFEFTLMVVGALFFYFFFYRVNQLKCFRISGSVFFKCRIYARNLCRVFVTLNFSSSRAFNIKMKNKRV